MIFDMGTSPATNFLMPLDFTYSSTHCLTLSNKETIQEKRREEKRREELAREERRMEWNERSWSRGESVLLLI